MDKKKILLVNLAKGKTGDVNAELLGLIIVSEHPLLDSVPVRKYSVFPA